RLLTTKYRITVRTRPEMIVPQSESSGFFIRISPLRCWYIARNATTRHRETRAAQCCRIVASAGGAGHRKPSSRWRAVSARYYVSLYIVYSLVLHRRMRMTTLAALETATPHALLPLPHPRDP